MAAQLRLATEEEIERWDELVVANPDGGHYLQSKAWGQFRSHRGYRPRYYIFENGSTPVAVLFLERRVASFGRLWYASKGPGLTSEADFEKFTEVLRPAASGAFMARLEPTIVQTPDNKLTVARSGLECAKQQILKATIIVDIAPDEETVIASFKQKTRYNIRLAGRHGVAAAPVESSDENLNRMYDLMHVTQQRAGYFLHTREYFIELWKALAAAGHGQLFFASFEGQVLAGVYAVHMGTKGWYKDGGSVREHTNVMAPYLLQWEVMRWLKGQGVTTYDLVGVAPRDQAGHHIMDSLEHFKLGFSQNIVEFVGTFDLPLKPVYKLWKAGGERVTVAYHARVKKEFLY